MSNFLREKQISFLQRLKPILLSQTKLELNNHIFSNSSSGIIEIDDLIKRLERIEKMLEIGEKEGVRTSKVKEQIISLLQQNKKLTASQLSKLIGLSRTRCSEYFRELTKEGITEGVIINRQKYYKLVGK